MELHMDEKLCEKLLGDPWWNIFLTARLPDGRTKKVMSICIQPTKKAALDETRRKLTAAGITIVDIYKIQVAKPTEKDYQNVPIEEGDRA